MYKLRPHGFIGRLSDGADIPPNEANSDYKEYQKWLAAGNTPQPDDSVPFQPTDFSNLDNLDKVLKAILLVMRQYTNALAAGTHTQKTVAQLKADLKTAYDALP